MGEPRGMAVAWEAEQECRIGVDGAFCFGATCSGAAQGGPVAWPRDGPVVKLA